MEFRKSGFVIVSVGTQEELRRGGRSLEIKGPQHSHFRAESAKA